MLGNDSASQPALEQPRHKLSSSKCKQVAGTPVDTDQEAYEALRATALLHKVCMCNMCSLARQHLHWHQILWRKVSCLSYPDLPLYLCHTMCLTACLCKR